MRKFILEFLAHQNYCFSILPDYKYFIYPHAYFSRKCFDRPSLFAGKMHVFLFRKWINRVKGRDWYDLAWYIKKGIPLDLNHFAMPARDTGNWNEGEPGEGDIMEMLKEKFRTVSFENVREDVRPFIKDDKVLDIWSEQYFKDLTDRLKFQ